MSGVAVERRLIILRHGQSEHNASGLWQGQLDSALSELGVAQAAAAGSALRAFGPVRVVASDLVRAYATGEAVARACGIPIVADERFREIHDGAWQGLSGAEVHRDWPEDMERIRTGEDFKRGDFGESIAEVAARCAAGVVDVLADLGAGECAVIATHGVAGRALVADLVGMPQQLAWLAVSGLENCHWAELREGESEWRIKTWNVSAPSRPREATP